MDAPVSIEALNSYDVDQRMEAILSIDNTKGNRIINTRGFSISPTIKDGYILRVSEDLLEIMQNVTAFSVFLPSPCKISLPTATISTASCSRPQQHMLLW